MIRAELLKQRTVPTAHGLPAAMVVLVSLAVVLHGSGLPSDAVDSRAEQLNVVFRWGPLFGALFAALAGALAMTGEFRYGTIRPTVLIEPRRERVLVAKALASAVWGAGLGALAALTAVAVGVASLAARSVDVHVDLASVVGGATLAAVLWAPLGVGLGALIRRQVPVVVGLCTWMLLIENLLLGAIPSTGRFAPGLAGAAVAGIDPDTLLAPLAGGALLVLYAAVAVAAGTLAFVRRDIA